MYFKLYKTIGVFIGLQLGLHSDCVCLPYKQKLEFWDRIDIDNK